MNIKIDKQGSIDNFKQMVSELANDSNVKGMLILCCDNNGFTPELLDPVLKDISVPVFGGIFPGLIHNNEVIEQGTVIGGFFTEPNVQLISSLSDESTDFDDVIDEKFPQSDVAEQTMFVIVDSMANKINTLLESLFNIFGLEIRYLGGGAGSLSMQKKPCIITNAGLSQDSAVLAMLKSHSGVGVSHGMEPVCGPYKITEAKNKTVYSLNWEPAYSLYQKEIKDHSEIDPTDMDFFGINRHFALGINRLGSEKIIREPIVLGEDNSLYFLPEMREGEFMSILSATGESTIEAAKKAYQQAQDDYKGSREKQTTVCFDCISRYNILSERYGEAIDQIHDQAKELIGTLSMGEIANNGKDYIDYYNRTCVVGVLED